MSISSQSGVCGDHSVSLLVDLMIDAKRETWKGGSSLAAIERIYP